MNEPSGRRPLNSRSWKWVRNLASVLATAGVSPNAVSMAGLVCGVLAGVCLAVTSVLPADSTRMFFIGAAVLIQLRLLANLIDGLVAVEGGRKSPVGGIYNELPDRITDAAIFIGAGYAACSVPVLGWLAALLAVIVAYLRALGVTLGTGEAFIGVMAKPQRMFLMTVACVGSAVVKPSVFPVMAVVLGVIGLGCVITFFQRLLWISKKLKWANA